MSNTRYANNQLEISQFLIGLKGIDPRTCDKQLLVDLVFVCFSIDVEIYHRIVDWLKGHFEWKKAQSMVDQVIKRIQQDEHGNSLVPFKFRIVGYFEWCVVFPTETYNSTSNTTVLEISTTRQLMHLPAISSDRTVTGYVHAIIKTGDLLQLRTHIKKWWLVQEVRPSSGTLLLRLYSDSNTLPKPLMMDKSPQALPHCQYKEVHLISLLGAMVWRDGALPMKNLDELHKTHEDHLSLVKSQRKLLNVASMFQFPGPSSQAALARMKTFMQSHENRKLSNSQFFPNNNNNNNLQSSVVHPIQQLQQRAQLTAWTTRKECVLAARRLMQKIDPYYVIHRDVWVLLCRALKSLSKGGFDLYTDLEEWVKKSKTKEPSVKERLKFIRCAWKSFRPLTNADHPSIVKTRAFLKCRGITSKRTIFDEFGHLSSHPESEGGGSEDPLVIAVLETATEFLSGDIIFAEQDSTLDSDDNELLETADVDDILYAHNNNLNVKTQELTKPLNSEVSRNKTAKPANSKVLKNKTSKYSNSEVLKTSSQIPVTHEQEVNVPQAPQHVVRPAMVPMALYAYSNSVQTNTSSIDHMDEFDLSAGTTAAVIDGPGAMSLGNLLCMQEGRASISVGDAICLSRATWSELSEVLPPPLAAAHANMLRGSADVSDLGGRIWLRVQSIDLLWARLKVSLCLQPPRCWQYEHGREEEVEAWIPISALWAVLVCRRLDEEDVEIPPESAHRGSRKKNKNLSLRYLSYVTPIPSSAKALSVLTKFASP